MLTLSINLSDHYPSSEHEIYIFSSPIKTSSSAYPIDGLRSKYLSTEEVKPDA